MDRTETTVATSIIGEDSNAIVHDLIYHYSSFLGSNSTAHDFVMQITDPQNPLLLFDYKISSYEFPQLRESQQLLCEYACFPRSLTNLLDHCNRAEDFKAVIDQRLSNGPCLLLQQITKFSLITHLKLPLVPANESRLNEYLSSEVHRFKEAFEASQAEIVNLQGQMDVAEERAKRRHRRLEDRLAQQECEYSAQMEALKERCEAALAEQRESSSSLQEQHLLGYEKKEQAMLTRFETQIADLRRQVSDVTTEKGALLAQSERSAERISSLEAQLAESKARLHKGEAGNKELQDGQNSLLVEVSALKSELAAIKTKYEALQIALQQKNETVASSATTIDELRAMIARKDLEIMQLQKQCAEFQEHAKDRDWLAEKSKQVIARHQEDIKKLIQHHNERKALWQAKMDEMQQIELASVKKDEEIKALKLIVDRSEHKTTELRDQTEELRAAVTKLEEENSESKQMIAYLERELNKKGRELLDEDALDGDELASSAHTPLRRFGSPKKGGELMDYIPAFPETTSLFDNPEFY
jgi:hypothetical protein